MKKFLLLFLVSFLLINCEKPTENIDTTNEVELYFNSDHSALFPYEFVVDWSEHETGYSEELGSNYEEYDLIWTGDITPSIVDAARYDAHKTEDSDFNSVYKVLAVEKDGGYEFYSLTVKGNKSSESGVSLSNLNGYDGLVNIKDSEGNDVLLQNYYGDGHSSKLYFDSKSIPTLTRRCTTITIVTTNTFYNVRPGGVLEFNFESTSTQEYTLCGDEGGGGAPLGGGEAGGGAAGGGSGGDGNGNNTPDTLTYYGEIFIEEPACESFDFKQVTSVAEYQAATIKDFEMGVGVALDNNYQSYRIKFPLLTFETWIRDRFDNYLSPGAAAELSAQALHETAWATTKHFLDRHGFTEYDVKKYFEDELKRKFRSLTDGGTVVRGNPYNLTPKQFKTGDMNGCD